MFIKKLNIDELGNFIISLVAKNLIYPIFYIHKFYSIVTWHIYSLEAKKFQDVGGDGSINRFMWAFRCIAIAMIWKDRCELNI